MSLATRKLTMMLPVTDVDRAREFYSDRLGLDYQGQNIEGSAVFGVGGGASLVLLPRPESKPSPSTALSFEVDDVRAEVDELVGRGVVFEDYDLGELKTVGHIADFGGDQSAWFLDPDGNVLCVHSGNAMAVEGG
jgi:catechol 2,3-dioxygenase-like lactoylglutathione lyase family enzyme